jgi:hypothetical protein
VKESAIQTTKDLLIAAKDLLIEGGWVKQIGETADGRHCVIGALAKLLKGTNRTTYHYAICFLENAIQELNPEDDCDYLSDDVVSFNDRENTTFNDIMDVFDRAIILEKEAKSLPPLPIAHYNKLHKLW